MRERGELDTQIYEKVKADQARLKKEVIEPREFPVTHDQIKYPEPALKVGNPLYQTSNMSYGGQQPA